MLKWPIFRNLCDIFAFLTIFAIFAIFQHYLLKKCKKNHMGSGGWRLQGSQNNEEGDFGVE